MFLKVDGVGGWIYQVKYRLILYGRSRVFGIEEGIQSNREVYIMRNCVFWQCCVGSVEYLLRFFYIKFCVKSIVWVVCLII